MDIGDIMNLRIVYMGTPAFGLPTLEALYNSYDVVGVVCQPDKPGSRGEVKYSPIKDFALSHNIGVFQPANIKEDYKEILDVKPDIIITCAYGQIIPKELLDYPKYGCINIHASLLPKLRGGAPIHHAIIDGYDKTGVTIMYMVMKMDAGSIIAQESIPILESDNVGTLHDKLSVLGRDLMLKTLPNIISGNINPIKQNEDDVTYGFNIKPEEEKIDYSKNTRQIINQIRGLNPFPGAYSLLEGRRVKMWNAKEGTHYTNEEIITGQVIYLYPDGIGIKTGNGEIIITELQLEGKRKMTATEFLNGVVNKELLIGRVFE